MVIYHERHVQDRDQLSHPRCLKSSTISFAVATLFRNCKPSNFSAFSWEYRIWKLKPLPAPGSPIWALTPSIWSPFMTSTEEESQEKLKGGIRGTYTSLARCTVL